MKSRLFARFAVTDEREEQDELHFGSQAKIHLANRIKNGAG